MSCLYDIQIKCISNFLANPHKYSDIDIVKTLSLIYTDFQKPPRKSANSIICFPIFVDFGERNGQATDEIFEFFVLNCKECGYTPYVSGTSPQCAYKKASDYTESDKNKGFSRWCVYSLSTSRNVDNPNELVIKCYIIKNDELRKYKNDSLKALKQAAKDDFLAAFINCKEYYRRDQLWNKICENSTNFAFSDLSLVLGASKVCVMHDIDPRIRYLTSIKKVFDISFINYLKEAYSKNSQIFDEGNLVYLIVTYSVRNLAQVILNKEEQTLKMFAVSRSIGSSLKEEDDNITDLVNKIIQWLWVRVTNN